MRPQSNCHLFVAAALLAACSDHGSTPASLAVTTLLPAADATTAERLPAVAVVFDGEVDAASVAADQIVVQTTVGAVSGTTTLVGKNQLRFVATAELPWGTLVSARLRAGIRARSGAALTDDVRWRFRVQDAELRSVSLPIADAGLLERAVVAAPPGDRFAVAVGADVWTLFTPAAPPPALGAVFAALPPVHDTFPFRPSFTAATPDGALAGVLLNDLGGSANPDLFLLMSVLRGDGSWQNSDARVLAGATASLFTFAGGNGGAFVATLARLAGPSLRFAVGPRATPPVFALFDNPDIAMPTTLAALGGDAAVVCQATAPQSQSALYTRFDLATDPPTPTASWPHAFGVLASDLDGELLVLTEGGGELALERLGSDGAVARSAAVVEPANMPLAIWRILPGRGAAAAIGARFGTCRSFRLDASDAAPQVRSFPLDQDAIDTGAWDACYAPSGDLLVVARRRATTASEGSLWLWRQRPGEDWVGEELVAEVLGRPLARPGIAVDAVGRMRIAVPRGAPAEVIIARGESPAVAPALR